MKVTAEDVRHIATLSRLTVPEAEMEKQQMTGPYLMWNMSDLDARNLCKHRLDVMEHWSRRLIDESLKQAYGDDYVNVETADGQPLIKKAIKDRVNGRTKDNPKRFARWVDALAFDDLSYFFCKEEWYANLYKSAFEPFYSGVEEVRSVLSRMTGIRNKLAHGNHLSQHELEQGVCYSNDFIGVFIDYYKKIGKEKTYNVPTFISVKDSLGRSFIREDSSCGWEIYDKHFVEGIPMEELSIHLRAGDLYRLVLEVDDCFPEDCYKIEWWVYRGVFESIAKGTGNIIEFKLNDDCVSYSPEVEVWLTTMRSWHRFGKHDDSIKIRLSEVYPPIEDL